MNLSQLQYFCKLAELQHYTKAAEQLYITQPTLSNSISRLEDELGIPLFVRDGRNVRLTKYGREFNEYAKEALAAIERGKALAQDEAGEYTGNVSIGTIYTVEDHYLPMLMKAYREQFGSGPVIRVAQGLTQSLIEGLENDTYDVIFSAYVPNKPDLQFVPVTYQDLVAIVHSRHKLAKQSSIMLGDLRGDHIITYHYNTPIGREVKEVMNREKLLACEQYDDEITLASMVDANKDAVSIALNTLGINLFPNLIKLKIEDIPERFHTIHLAYKKNSYKTPAVQHFVDLAREFKYEKQ
ncbi:LysR family transcriptional regulator [Denitrobacterium detoxificans]|jgi:DNA-binding transcriptional LysR family regulator|uniref:LysR family transcriptional regulator n=1 Tax=Denitrobacterium detoxificans TaxID=79604 RepID=UPI0026EBD856|nr:LysR family transcriptional regulator [Denitrobacterium detoxificans]MBE6465291.1 LysR family transcriptional regulator [Denitrobacterium detoxificans]